ncbi:hypothetical protein HRbin15_00839 [bacterium HR15]|nr:hypothetical protein HRbin15_00839 [bacterium HR15]
MQGSAEILNGDGASVDSNFDGQFHGVREAREQHGRGNPRSVGHRVGIWNDAIAHRVVVERYARNVARRNDQRESEGRLPSVQLQQAIKCQGNLSGFAGHQVPHAYREHIGALLFQHRRAMPLSDCLLVFLTRLLTLLQHALNHATADAHREIGNACAVGQRKDIDGFQGLRRGVLEGLTHNRLHEHTANIRLHRQLGQGQVAHRSL